VAAHSASGESQNRSILTPLSQVEKEHLLTRAAIPYRDPGLSDSTEVIMMRRQQEQQASSLEPTSRWQKRWLLGTQGRDFMGSNL
jgi:tRNA U34 5-methylaminomethyl-2-thiouridine-forming methyltransferase MnmC